MNLKNIEFKAKVNDLNFFEDKLRAVHATFLGTHAQKDTYFNTTIGRLKLREYDGYSALIYYNRDETKRNKLSEVMYYKHETNMALLEILKLQMGVKVCVEKVRKLYKVDNVSIHLDTVKGLGTYIEVEACNDGGKYSDEQLEERCTFYYDFFALEAADLIAPSYSDLILASQH